MLDPTAAEQLFEGSRQLLQRPLTEIEKNLFDRYLSIMLRWSRTFHLTAYRSHSEIVEKLFLDSLLFLEVLPACHSPLLDLGTGVGVPGIPLKIADSGLALTLLEGQRRRASFLATAVRELALKSVRVIHARAEKALKEQPEMLEHFQTVTARAMAPIETVVPLAEQFLRPGGTLVVSGPPAPGPFQPPPGNDLERWKSVSFPGASRSRQFFVMQKAC